MSNLFIDIKRPRAEQNIINNFIKIYKRGMSFYKSKDYSKALDEFRSAYELLEDIWDEYPKICTLYLITKSLFHNRNYGECLSLHDEIMAKIEVEKKRDNSKIKKNMFIKIEAKMDAYHLLINFILDNASKSIECALNMIKFLSQDKNMSLEDKTVYFYNYIKSFIQMSGITKSNIFKDFKKAYDSMIIEEKLNNGNLFNESSSMLKYMNHHNKKINPSIIDNYKTLMNIKLKSHLYELLDSEYYLLKFGIENDKVINFLHKNMSIYVYEKNLEKLLNLFTIYLALGKIDLEKKFNMTMKQIIFLQKSRMEDFDIIFSNLTGGFFHIFKTYMQTEKKIYFGNPTIDINQLKTAAKVNNMDFSKTYRGRESFKFNLINQNAESSKNIPTPSFDSFKSNKSDINILKSFTKIEKKNIFSDMINKNKKIAKIKKNIILKNKLIDFRLNSARKSDLTFNKNISNKNNYLSERSTKNNFKIKFPDILNKTKINKNKFILNFFEKTLIKRNNFLKNNNDKNHIKNTTEDSEEKNIKEKIRKKKLGELREVNNLLINILMNLFTPILKLENNLYIEQEKINYKKIFPRRIDLFKEPQIKSLIRSYHYHWSPNSILKENHNCFFYNENYLLIQNLIFLGICRGYGNMGQPISNRMSNLFPCILLYIMIEDSLKLDKKEINKEIYKLFKTEEKSKYFKDMFLLRYILSKFQMDITNTPLLTNNTLLLKKQINEAFFTSIKELKSRHQIFSDSSLINIFYCFILEKIIYIFHSGYFEMIVGKYNKDSKEWEKKTIVKQTEYTEEYFQNILNLNQNYNYNKPTNKKKKENINNKSKSEFEKNNNDDYSFEDDKKKEIELNVYKIEPDDKFIVIGSKGIFNNLKSKEIINEVGDFYINNKNADEAAFYLMDLIKTREVIYQKQIKPHQDYDELDDIFEKEKKKLWGYYNDLACIIIFLE